MGTWAGLCLVWQVGQEMLTQRPLLLAAPPLPTAASSQRLCPSPVFSHLLPQPLPADSSGTASWHRLFGQDVSIHGGGDRCTGLAEESNPVGARMI